MDYKEEGRSEQAIRDIASLDSDGDGYFNDVEIAALRHPGNPDDDPSKVPAPYRIYARDELEEMPQHTQFMLMNTHKSGDAYVEYKGVPVENLLDDAGSLSSATGIKVYAADGFDPDTVLGHPAPVPEPGRPVVSGTGIDFR